MSWTTPGDSLPEHSQRVLTPDEHLEIHVVLEAAADWEAGLLPAPEAAKLGELRRGGRPSPAYTRFVAVQLTPRSDPRRAALQALQKHLDQMKGLTVTPTGTLTSNDMHDIRTARDLVGRLAS